MKKQITALLVGSLLACATSAWSLTLTISDGTDVGQLDTLAENADGDLGRTKLDNAGDATQLKWVNDFLGTNYSSFTYVDSNLNGDFKQVYGGSNTTYAYDLNGTPEYFLIKTGNIGTGYDTFLFKNNDSFDWAVIDLDAYSISGLGKLSKLDEVGTAPVPEPGTMMLLGAGFLSLAVYGKRRRNA